METNYSRGKAWQAVYELGTGSGTIQERLWQAWIRVDGIGDRLEDEAKESFRALAELVSKHGDQTSSSVAELSDEEAIVGAKIVLELYEQLDANSSDWAVPVSEETGEPRGNMRRISGFFD